MRWTSSDLIIAIAAPRLDTACTPDRRSRAAAETRSRSVGRRRVPKGQETVKIELLDGLHGGGAFDAPGERFQPHRVEHVGGREVEHRQVAETGLELPIAHRQLGIDGLFL